MQTDLLAAAALLPARLEPHGCLVVSAVLTIQSRPAAGSPSACCDDLLQLLWQRAAESGEMHSGWWKGMTS